MKCWFDARRSMMHFGVPQICFNVASYSICPFTIESMNIYLSQVKFDSPRLSEIVDYTCLAVVRTIADGGYVLEFLVCERFKAIGEELSLKTIFSRESSSKYGQLFLFHHHSGYTRIKLVKCRRIQSIRSQNRIIRRNIGRRIVKYGF